MDKRGGAEAYVRCYTLLSLLGGGGGGGGGNAPPHPHLLNKVSIVT